MRKRALNLALANKDIASATRHATMLLMLASLGSLAACGNACINNGDVNCTTGAANSSSSGGSGTGSSSSSGGSSSSSGGAGSVSFAGSVTPSTIKLGSTAQISVEITNSQAAADSGLSTSIEFSSTLSVNVPPAYSCTPGSVTTDTSGASIEINLSGASVPAASNCELTVTVTPPSPGDYKIIAGQQDVTLTVQ